MIAAFKLRPFDRPHDRQARLWYLGLALLGSTALALWNPSERPGPTLCLSRLTVGLPCPFCGVTRGYALCLRGHPIQATHYNPLSVPVCLTALVLVARWTFEYARNRQVVLSWRSSLGRAFVVVCALVLLAVWIYLLEYRREDEFARSWLGRLVGLMR
jgi:hypothetical protein